MKWNKLLISYKCIHCNNICDNNIFKICDNCISDTCWHCFNKVGYEKLYVSMFNDSYFINCPEFRCIKQCIYKCNKCNYTFNKNNVYIDKDKCKIFCYFCK